MCTASRQLVNVVEHASATVCFIRGVCSRTDVRLVALLHPLVTLGNFGLAHRI